MKKIFLVIIFLFSSILLNAHPFKEYVLNSNDLHVNLRAKPSMNGEILQKLNVKPRNLEDNFSLYLKNIEGNWYYFEVSYGFMDPPKYGYIHKSQVKLHPDSYIVNSKKGYILLNDGTNEAKRLENGSYVTKIGEEGNWFMVQYDNFDKSDAPWTYIKKEDLKKIYR